MAKGGQAVTASAIEVKKRKPSVRIGISDYEKQVPIKGIKNLKLNDNVCVIIIGKVKSLNQSEYDNSVSVEIDECSIKKHSGNVDMEDLINNKY